MRTVPSLPRWQAVDCFGEALRLHRRLGDRFQETTVLRHLGETYLAIGDHDAVRGAWEAAFSILDELRHPDAGTLRGKLDAIDGYAPAGPGQPRRGAPR